jgi:ABC-type transport system involved in multi-copper enzyme maturation permease subunit
MAQKGFSLSIQTIKALSKRDLYSTLRSWGIYIVAFLSFIASSFILKNYLDSIQADDILISADPLNYPLFISVIIISFYLAILSAISISREKDQGTLEVLFYGPVSCLTYILGKYIKDILTYLVMVVFFLVYFWGVSLLTNLGFSYGLLKTILVSIFSVSCIVSFGLFISCLTGKMRNSIIWLVGILALFLAIQIGQTILLGMPEENMSPVLTYLGDTLSLPH